MDVVEAWVRDQLHEILGMSDRHVAQFLVGTAQRSSSSVDFLSRLTSTGAIDVTDKVRSFAEELWLKVRVLVICIVYLMRPVYRINVTGKAVIAVMIGKVVKIPFLELF